LDYLGCIRPQEIAQPTINGTGIVGPITGAYVQNTALYSWSYGDIWHVPPLPGPSHGYLQPNSNLSDTNLELLA